MHNENEKDEEIAPETEIYRSDPGDLEMYEQPPWYEHAKRLMKSKGVTQRELAEALSVTEGSVNHYLNGRREPTLAQVQRICRELGTTIDELSTNSLEPVYMALKAATKEIGEPGWSHRFNSHNTGATAPIQAVVPIISWVQAGAGGEAIDNFSVGDADEWVPTSRKVGGSAYALRVVGDSMTAPFGKSFPEDTVIIVDPDVKAESGSFIVARIGDAGEATFKQYVVDGGRKFLKPLNPQYPTITIDESTMYCGSVVQAIIDV